MDKEILEVLKRIEKKLDILIEDKVLIDEKRTDTIIKLENTLIKDLQESNKYSSNLEKLIK